MVELKGKVACGIHHQVCEFELLLLKNFKELLVTELILDNKFSNRSCAEIAALLSPLTAELSSKYKNEDIYNLTIKTEKAPEDVINQVT